ncbi:MAG: ABC transporter ATP-binding protein [Gammaproteobacteria bacterium]|nr:ABC transporter ATP-binding protein [Gammaproteobacteria bacterium]MBA3731095.1 ABC transporter ATP-binding protein [Gammaproteobacteria bacterium]
MRLAARELAFGYPGKPVGREVNLALQTGEILCLLGPNGSGKTTLFKTLLGVLKPQGGDVTLDGKSIAGWSRRRVAQEMAYVPQAQAGYFPFTVTDTVLMGRTARMGLFALPAKHDREAALAALATLRISELKDEPYTQLSSGQRQLVLIARALAQGAKFLIMDEPTASLDFGNRVRVLDHARRLAREGLGIVFSTHDPDQALACADQVALLHEGRLIHRGAPEEVITRENLRLIYGVEVEIAALASQRHVCVQLSSGD